MYCQFYLCASLSLVIIFFFFFVLVNFSCVLLFFFVLFYYSSPIHLVPCMCAVVGLISFFFLLEVFKIFCVFSLAISTPCERLLSFPDVLVVVVFGCV